MGFYLNPPFLSFAHISHPSHRLDYRCYLKGSEKNNQGAQTQNLKELQRSGSSAGHVMALFLARSQQHRSEKIKGGAKSA